jgi:hypothetical protein
MLKQAACLAHHGTKFKLHGLEVALDPRAACGFERSNQSISPDFINLQCGHDAAFELPIHY